MCGLRGGNPHTGRDRRCGEKGADSGAGWRAKRGARRANAKAKGLCRRGAGAACAQRPRRRPRNDREPWPRGTSAAAVTARSGEEAEASGRKRLWTAALGTSSESEGGRRRGGAGGDCGRAGPASGLTYILSFWCCRFPMAAAAAAAKLRATGHRRLGPRRLLRAVSTSGSLGPVPGSGRLACRELWSVAPSKRPGCPRSVMGCFQQGLRPVRAELSPVRHAYPPSPVEPESQVLKSPPGA